jgi:hypothetical protein
LHERVRVRHGAVVAKQVLEELYQRALAVLAHAVQDRHRALLGGAREAVAQVALDEADELLVDEDLLEEPVERGGLSLYVELDRRQLGDQILGVVGPQGAGPKVQRAVLDCPTPGGTVLLAEAVYHPLRSANQAYERFVSRPTKSP